LKRRQNKHEKLQQFKETALHKKRDEGEKNKKHICDGKIAFNDPVAC
jgi:hypothetical protein